MITIERISKVIYYTRECQGHSRGIPLIRQHDYISGVDGRSASRKLCNDSSG